MGNSTIIEFNHDMVSTIYQNDESKKLFLEQLNEQFSHNKYEGEFIFGGRVIAFFSRYDPINNIWCKFKRKYFQTRR